MVNKYYDLPTCKSAISPIREQSKCLEKPAIPLGKMIVSAQIDGSSLNNTTLLSRQYDDAFGSVDPLSDIHTDPDLFRSEMIRTSYNTKMAQSATTSPTD